jgi:NADPH:quinone reductase-like Zn-dependent oxidoreductase
MRAVQIKKFGPVEKVLKIEEIPVPTVGDENVLVEVHATSMNPFDYKTINGAIEIKSLVNHKFPLTVGIDLSGTVSRVGSRVTRFRPGDEVFAKMPGETSGAFSEFVVTKESWLAPKPKTISHEEAASIPLVGLTTWQALIDTANLKKGQKVFIQGGSGGIGTFAIQLAKYIGATIATTASGENAELVKRLGADLVIDYRAQNFRDILKDYDVVYDTLGRKALEDSLYVLKRGGIVVTIAGVPDSQFSRKQGIQWYLRAIFYLMNTKIRNLCHNLGIRYNFVLAQSRGDELTEISKLIDQGEIRPIIDKVFPFEETKEAMLYLKKGKVKGKVVAKIR